MDVVWVGSPNKDEGREALRPMAVVIHIMDGTLHGTDTWFLDPASRVSAHYGVGTVGAVHQYVAEGDTVWHTGRRYRPTWKLIKDTANPNFYTIGVEHDGQADTPWPIGARSPCASPSSSRGTVLSWRTTGRPGAPPGLFPTSGAANRARL